MVKHLISSDQCDVKQTVVFALLYGMIALVICLPSKFGLLKQYV